MDKEIHGLLLRSLRDSLEKQLNYSLKGKVSSNKNEECLPLSRPTNNYSQLHQFGENFATLVKGLENVGNNFSGDAIMFVGNTGAGKSSLVHLLAGNSDGFIAVEDGEGSNDFYILDTTGNEVTNTTTDSTTTYPKVVEDSESGVIFFDTPGFRDTRSSIHEVIATYGLQRVAQLCQRIKFALLINSISLSKGGTRDDFTNTLQSFFSLLNNPTKYKDSTHLVATKLENRNIVNSKNQTILVSDQTVVKTIIGFLASVEESLKKRELDSKFNNKQFLSNAQSLVQKWVENQSRIALFRKPNRSGPVMDSETIRQSLASIRNTLLSPDGYVDVELNDFGFTLSDKAKIYIRELFDLMNSYIIDVSKSFTVSFDQFLTNRCKSFVDIAAIRKCLISTKKNVDVLIKSANASTNPSDFADALRTFMEGVDMKACSNDTFREIKQLDDVLSNLKNVTDENRYSPAKWADSLYDIERIAKDALDYYVMLNNLFDKLTDHSALNDYFYEGLLEALTKKGKKSSLIISKHSYAALMEHLGLNQFAGLTLKEEQLNEISDILLTMKERVLNVKFSCKNKTLFIVGSFLQLQSLDKNKLASCKNATTVALLATNKLYVDTNIGVDVLGGRNLVIIAPQWQVMGKFVISVDGASRGPEEAKASFGAVGHDGKSGQSAGKFVGVALEYHNSKQLTITANGGDGQNGQAGGDGRHGKDGHDGHERTTVDENLHIYVAYNKKKDTQVIKSKQGTEGGDAGMGGVGGAGGWNGSIVMHSLTHHSPDRSTHVMLNGTAGKDGANGIPGQGGINGCDAYVKSTKHFILFIPVGYSSNHEIDDQCERRNSNGELVPNSGRFSELPTGVPDPPPVCELYKQMSGLFERWDDIFSHAIFQEFQSAFNSKFHCTT